MMKDDDNCDDDNDCDDSDDNYDDSICIIYSSCTVL